MEGWSAGAELQAVFYFISSFYSALAVGGLGFEFCLFVAAWRPALWSEWPFINNNNRRLVTLITWPFITVLLLELIH